MKYNALLLEHEGRINESIMLSALKQSELLNSCYAYKSRVKTEEKLIEKVKIRRDEGFKDYNINNITDVVGLRLITLFRVDMVSIFENIINIIKHEYNLTPNPIKKDSIEELIFYSNRTNDNINLLLRDVAVKLGVEDKYKMKQKEGEYSSIHIVARLNKRVNTLSGGDSIYYIPVEIQIRTVFEDAWGEVDHKYGYSIKKGKKIELKIRNHQNVLRHLDTLKKFSDACGEYADAIHLGILTDNCDETVMVNLFSVESDQETIDIFRTGGVCGEDIDRYIEARKLRENGLSSKKNGDEKFEDKLLEAANLFNDLSNKYINDGLIVHRIFYYYSKMNHAFCLLSTNMKKEAQESLLIYEELEREYKDFLLVKMRLAQAYGQNSLIDLSLKKCEETYLIYQNIRKIGFNPSIELPTADFTHIKKYLPKVYGYWLWMKSSNIKTVDVHSALKKSKFLMKAYFLTKESLEEDSDSVSLYNNMLYYAVELSKINKIYSTVKVRKEILNSIGNNLAEIVKRIDVENTKDIDTLDTMAKAYNNIGNIDDRNHILDILIPLAEASLNKQGCDNEITEEIIREAYEMRT